MTVHRWNDDKPHRCPKCHAIAVDMGRPTSWWVYTCCRCGAKFTRWPRLSRLLPKAGVRCSEHRTTAADACSTCGGDADCHQIGCPAGVAS